MKQENSEINDYILKEDIGQGNFGKVKLAVNKLTNEEYAIKVINKKIMKIKMKNVMFKENEIITKFNHINVIYVYEIIETAENYYIVMEYCKRGELFNYIVEHQRLSEEEASVFFYQIINGVEHIHSKGIAHRDLKPENILLTEDKIVKIIDFGLSHEFNGEELLKTKCGSASYASPELISEPFYDGFKNDVWCCGIILYAMLCGYLPFEKDRKERNNYSLFKNILQCNFEIPDFISNLSEDLIVKLLNVKSFERISISQIKNHPFYLKGKSLCNLDYALIEEKIIKKRCYKNYYNIDTNEEVYNKSKSLSKKINNNNLQIIINNFSDENRKDNNISNNENSLNNKNVNKTIEHTQYKGLSPFIKKTKQINEHMIIKDKFYQNNNQILNPDKNKYNLNLLSKLNQGSIKLIDKIFSTKYDYNNTLDEDKLYDNNYLSSINKEKINNNIFKLTKRNIGFPQNKNFVFLKSLNNTKNNRNKFLNHIETPEYIFEQNNKIVNDNKLKKDEILLRKNKLKNDNNINIIYGYNEDDLKNYKINENNINRIISISNEHRLGRDLNINHNKNKKNNLRTFTSIQEDENDILYKGSISKINNTRNNKRKDDLSFKEVLYNKNNNLHQNMEHNKESLYLNTIESNSIINKSNKMFDLNSNNKDNYIIALNKEKIFNTENNNNKIKPLSLPKNYRKINDKFNFSKIIQNGMHGKDFSNKFLLKKKNKSNFNKNHMNYKTIEPYQVKNRNNTIDNNRIQINLTKRLKDINFEKKDLEFKTINDDLMKNIFLKNTKFEIKKKKNDFFTPMAMNDNFIPLLTENNRNKNIKMHN